LELARQKGLSLDELRAGLNLGGMLSSLGELQRAAELLRAAIAFADQSRIELHTSSLLEKLAYVELELGRWEESRALLVRAFCLSDGQIPDLCLYAVRGELLLRQGRPEETRRLLEPLLPEVEQLSKFHEQLLFLMTLAHAQLALGDMAAAALLVERCMDI